MNQTFTLVVNQVPAITSTNSDTFVTGQSGTFKVTTTGAPTVALSVTAGTLPAGLRFVDAGNGTATVSGTPGSETSGTYLLTITAANSAGTSIQSFDLVVDSVPAFTSAAKVTFTTGTSGTFTATTSGFPTPALTLTGTLPSGLTFADNADGTATISGTVASGTAKKYTFTLKAKNTAGSVTQTFTLVVK